MKKFITLFFLIPFCIQAQIPDSVKLGYDYVSELKNGIAVFRDHQDNYGLLNNKGQQITTNKYDYITFTHNYVYIQAAKRINGKFKRGYLNLDGTEEIPLNYDDVYRSSKTGLIIAVNNSKFGAIDSLNNEVIPFKSDKIEYADDNGDYYFLKQNKYYAIYSNKGIPITDFIFSEISPFNNKGFATVLLSDNSATVIDTAGSFLFPPISNHSIKYLNEDFFKITDSKTKLSGLIDTKGKILIPCEYQEIDYANKTAIVGKNKKYGLKTINNIEITPVIYDYIIAEKELFEVKQNNLYGVITPSGETVIPTIYHMTLFIDEDKYIITEKDQLFGVFNPLGNNIVSIEYNFLRYSGNKIFAEKNKIPFIINLKEPVSITEIHVNKFKETTPSLIHEAWDKQIFEENGKFGIISIENKILVQAEYDNIEAIYISGEFIVKKANKYGIINYNNEIIKPIQYDQITIRKEYALLEEKDKKNEFYYVRFREHNTDSSQH